MCLKRRVKVLVLFPRHPYPVVSGDTLTRNTILKILNNYFDIDVIVVTDEESDQKEYLENNSSDYKIYSPPIWRFWLNTLSVIFNKNPIQINYFYFKKFHQEIKLRHNEKKYDIVFCYLLRMVKYTEGLNIPVYLDAQDSFYKRYASSYKATSSLFWKILYYIESKRFFRFEKKYVEESAFVSFVNYQETKMWDLPNVHNISNGVKQFLLDYNKKEYKYKSTIVFFGQMSYQPNVDAVLWFAKNVLQKLNKQIQFYIIGSNPNKQVISLASKYENVTVTGFIDDPYLIINSALCVVAPMFTGSGVQNKIIESMALGKAVLTTPLGANGIKGFEDGKNVLICNNDFEFASTINNIFVGAISTTDIGENAREIVKLNFSWESMEERIIENINNLIKQ